MYFYLARIACCFNRQYLGKLILFLKFKAFSKYSTYFSFHSQMQPKLSVYSENDLNFYDFSYYYVIDNHLKTLILAKIQT